MKKKSGDFKKRYGDRAKDVMYATATKMAMKEGFELTEEDFAELDEAMDTFTVKYKSRAGKEGQIKIKARDDNEAKAKARRQINNLANINSVVKEETE
jgi:hypothetical protein